MNRIRMKNHLNIIFGKKIMDHRNKSMTEFEENINKLIKYNLI